MDVKIKRVYDEPKRDDGTRILVDRLWPRGLSKGDAKVDIWLKDIAPTTELRTWFGHDPDKWDEFHERYRRELERNEDGVARLRDAVDKGPVTILYAAKDEHHNNAVVIRELVRRK
jgi:uncharacterized protein YeaO (DUF488 family)